MADASDSKSDVGDNVWVQVPPSAPPTRLNLLEFSLFFVAVRHCNQYYYMVFFHTFSIYLTRQKDT